MDIAAARDGLNMVISMERVVRRVGYEAAIAKWEALLGQLADYKYDSDGALREWAVTEYIENNNHRHLSHLYVAWPAYETQDNPVLRQGAHAAIKNRENYNIDDATAGHGWMHKALIQARLKSGDGVIASLLPMMRGDGYYSSLLTDHDSNRRGNSYCTDTLFGTVGAVNEALLFSNTGEIEILPALPSEWKQGFVNGLMARTWVEVKELRWDIPSKKVLVRLKSGRNDNIIRLKLGIPWKKALVNSCKIEAQGDIDPKVDFIQLNLRVNTDVTVMFSL